jgi:hypothetical protein
MGKVLRQLRRWGIDLSQLSAPEVLDVNGTFVTQDYGWKVASIEVWEIDPRHEPLLWKSLPRAKIKIADAFEEIKVVRAGHDLVAVDIPLASYGSHCEHFDLFPDLFRAAKASAILNLDVIPEAFPFALQEYSYLIIRSHLSCVGSSIGPTTLRGSRGRRCSQRMKIGLGRRTSRLDHIPFRDASWLGTASSGSADGMDCSPGAGKKAIQCMLAGSRDTKTAIPAEGARTS